MKKAAVVFIVFFINMFSCTCSVLGQDIIEIDSAGLTVNGHYIGTPSEDTLYEKYSINNFKTIIKKPRKYVRRSNTSLALCKNKCHTKFFANYSFVNKGNAPVIQFGHTYASKEFLTVKVLDLEIKNTTTRKDILNSKLYHLFSETKEENKESNSFYFKNIFDLNIDMMINVPKEDNAKVLDVWIYLNYFHEITDHGDN